MIKKLIMRPGTPLQQFLVTNHLQQTDLKDFLGLSKSTISQAVSGKSKLSALKLIELIENDRGWDTSMLSPDARINQAGNINTGDIINSPNVQNSVQINSEITRLIDMLEKKDSTIDSLIEQNGKLLDIIKSLKG